MREVALERESAERTPASGLGRYGLSQAFGTESESKTWAAGAACPEGKLARELIESLWAFQECLRAACPAAAAAIVPDVYWPPVSAALARVIAACDELEPHLANCKPWFQYVVRNLKTSLDRKIRFLRLDLSAVDGSWPLHPFREDQLGRIIHTLVYLPDIRLWRPISAGECGDSASALDRLVCSSVENVLGLFREDSDWLTWGTVQTLAHRCEDLLQCRRDLGYFLPSAPSQIRDVRLLADRLGSNEPALPFEEMDSSTAFRRALSSRTESPWSVETDNCVRAWLRRHIDWCKSCQSSQLASEQSSDLRPSPKRTLWNVSTANQRAVELLGKEPGLLLKPLREWSKLIGCSAGLVAWLPLWKTTQQFKRTASDDHSVVAKAMDPHFLAEAFPDGELGRLIREQAADSSSESKAAASYSRSRRSQRT